MHSLMEFLQYHRIWFHSAVLLLFFLTTVSYSYAYSAVLATVTVSRYSEIYALVCTRLKLIVLGTNCDTPVRGVLTNYPPRANCVGIIFGSVM